MRVAVIGPLELPARQGGMSRHVQELYPRLVARGHNVTVFSRSGPGDLDGVRLRPMRLLRRRGAERLHLSAAASAAASLSGFDVVHYHALVSTAFAFLPRVAARRVLVTVHRLEWQDEKWPALPRAVLKASERVAMASAAAVIAVSNVLGDDLRRRYPTRRIEVIANGVTSLPAPDTGALARLGLTAGRYLLSVGRIVPEKGVHVAVEAFRQLRVTQSGLELAVVGEPRFSHDYDAELRASAPDGVRFCGSQDGAALSALYANAAAFVTPSVREGLPLTVLEAMAAGRPVVASDIPEHREVLGEAGVYFPAGRSDLLAQALTRLLSDRVTADALGAAGRVLVAPGGRYDWETVADRTDEVLRSL